MSGLCFYKVNNIGDSEVFVVVLKLEGLFCNLSHNKYFVS